MEIAIFLILAAATVYIMSRPGKTVSVETLIRNRRRFIEDVEEAARYEEGMQYRQNQRRNGVKPRLVAR